MTQPSMSTLSSPQSPPRLGGHSIIPNEILEKIIEEFWQLTLSSKDRVSFMCNSMLVSSTWMSLYMRVSARDVHLPHSRFVIYFFQILHGKSAVYNTFGKGLHDFLCRSITFRRDHDSGAIEMPVYMVLKYLTEGQPRRRLTNLHRLSFELVDQTGVDAIFPSRNGSLSTSFIPIVFPSSITSLEFFFSYSTPLLDNKERMRDILLNVEQSAMVKGLGSFAPPFSDVHHICMHGVPVGSMRDILRVCPNLRTYDSDISLKDVESRLEMGIKLSGERKRARRGEEDAQAALDSEVEMRIEMQGIVDLGTDEDVLEAMGVTVEHDGDVDLDNVSSVLSDLREELSNMLEKERNEGQVDVLARKFLQKGIRVCEKIIADSSGAISIYSEETDSSSFTAPHSTLSSDVHHIDYSDSDTLSVTSIRVDEAVDLVNNSYGPVSFPCHAKRTKSSSSGSSSKPRSWFVIRRAASKIFGKILGGKS